MSAEATSPLFQKFLVSTPTLSSYSAVNLLFLLSAILLVVVVTKKLKYAPMRTAFQSSILTLCLFQFPLFLFSSVLESELDRYWLFAASIHIYVLGSLTWVLLTPKLTGNYARRSSGLDVKHPAKNGSSLLRRVFPVASVTVLFFTFLALYLGHVGFECTGLSAMIWDPGMTLMAREVSVKFVKASYATFALSLVVNVVGPILIVVLGEFILRAVKMRSWAVATTAGICVCIVLTSTLMSGAKGNLLPTLIVSGVALFLTFNRLVPRLIALVAVGCTFAALFVAVELVKDRQVANPTKPYPYGMCVAKLGSCESGLALAESLSSRVLTMGVWSNRVRPLQEDVAKNCGTSMALSSAPKVEAESTGESLSPPKAVTPSAAEASFLETSKFDLAMLYAGSIARRIFVVPLQIGAWHFQYADTVFSPGFLYLPFSKAISGERITDMPSRVHRRYAPIYSGGSTDSSGTAPTAFMISSAAYMGFAGVVFAILFILILDFVSALVAGRVSSHLSFALVGLVAVGNVNLMLTDFDSAMLSHGTAFAILLLLGLSVVDRFFAYAETRGWIACS